MLSGTAGCSGVVKGAGVAETPTSVLSAAGVGVASGALAGAAGAVKAASVRAASSSVSASAAREMGRA